MAQRLPLSSIRVIVSLRTLIAVKSAYSKGEGARARYSRTEAGPQQAGRTTAGR